jgi:hypothetical protein
MKNLDQLRAGNALKFWASDPVRQLSPAEAGAAVEQLAHQVLRSGLLAAMALGRYKGRGWEMLVREIGQFLSPGRMAVLPVATVSAEAFLNVLTHEKSDSLLLQRATAEALEYLVYLRRLAPRVKEAAGPATNP